MPTPGYPEDPKDYCPKLKALIDELNMIIKWRNNDLSNFTPGDTDWVGHRKRITLLEETRDKFQKKFNDFCPKNCP